MVTITTSKCFILSVFLLLSLLITIAQCEKYDDANSESKEVIHMKEIPNKLENGEESLKKSRKLIDIKVCKEDVCTHGPCYCCYATLRVWCTYGGKAYCEQNCGHTGRFGFSRND
ncbi:hypothetical protein vseg_010316 [Gypsophila vaccaria]